MWGTIIVAGLLLASPDRVSESAALEPAVQQTETVTTIQVQIQIQLTMIPNKQPLGEGIRRTAGALVDDPDWDGIMDEIHQARKVERRPQIDEE